MANKPHMLFWKDTLIGYVTDATWSDFPWVGGKLSIVTMSADMREVL